MKNELIDKNQELQKLINFIDMRFGVYLDTCLGFERNIESINKMQQESSIKYKSAIENFDKALVIYGEGNPSESVKVLHKKTQAKFKLNNSNNGINVKFAIYHCLSDIYNQWKKFKKNNLGKDFQDEHIDIFSFLRKLRNCSQHSIYEESIIADEIIKLKINLSGYPFKSFKINDTIILTGDDCNALIYEIKLQINDYNAKNKTR